MKTHFEFHPAQVAILRNLVFQPKAKFNQLNTTGLTSDHFTFHIKTLLEANFIVKEGEFYNLSEKGKEFAGRFDVDSAVVKLEKQAKIGAVVCCIKEEKGELQFLLQQRLKQPYFGYWGFMTGKVKWGEKVAETAERELQEEMGISADLSLFLITHKMDYNQNGALLEDKFFYEFIGTNPRGDLLNTVAGGENAWMSEAQIAKLSPTFPDLDKGIDAIKNFLETKQIVFKEKAYIAEGY